jgi:hypothetical protein
MSNVPTASCGCAFSRIPAPIVQPSFSSDFSPSAACRPVRPSLTSFSNRTCCGRLSNNRASCSRTQSRHPTDRLLALWTSPSNASNDLTFHFPCLPQASAMLSNWDPPQQDPSLWRLLCAADSHAQEAIARITVHCIV